MSDGPSRDPRSPLPAAIQAATADDLDAALRGIIAAAVAGLGPTGAAIFLADPDRAGLQLAASVGLDETDAGTLAEATAGQAARYDQASSDGEPLVVASVPLVIGRGGVESHSAHSSSRGRLRTRRPTTIEPSSSRSRRWRHLPPIAPVAHRTARSDPSGSSGWRTPTR